MLDKLVTDVAIDIFLDDSDEYMEIYDETLFTVARVNMGTVNSIELTVKEAKQLERQLHTFVLRHRNKLSTVKASKAKIKARAK